MTGPLVGYLMQSALLASGARVDVAGWTQVVAEPEIGVRLGADLPAGADRAAAQAAIATLSRRSNLPTSRRRRPATTSMPCWPATSTSAMSCSAPTAANGGDTAGLSSHVFRRGTLAAEAADPQALTGRIPDLLVHMWPARSPPSAKGSKPGDLIICGSTVPPMPLIEPDESRIRATNFAPLARYRSAFLGLSVSQNRPPAPI